MVEGSEGRAGGARRTAHGHLHADIDKAPDREEVDSAQAQHFAERVALGGVVPRMRRELVLGWRLLNLRETFCRDRRVRGARARRSALTVLRAPPEDRHNQDERQAREPE
jgi:hypothetical protein